MIEKVFKVGDTITIKRTSQAGTGYRYALVRLTGGVALERNCQKMPILREERLYNLLSSGFYSRGR